MGIKRLEIVENQRFQYIQHFEAKAIRTIVKQMGKAHLFYYIGKYADSNLGENPIAHLSKEASGSEADLLTNGTAERAKRAQVSAPSKVRSEKIASDFHFARKPLFFNGCSDFAKTHTDLYRWQNNAKIRG